MQLKNRLGVSREYFGCIQTGLEEGMYGNAQNSLLCEIAANSQTSIGETMALANPVLVSGLHFSVRFNSSTKYVLENYS